MPRIRSRVHRIFIRWLKANRSRFVYQPYVLSRHTDRIIKFTFIGIPGPITCSLNRYSGISVAVMYQGECWDMIGDFDVAEERTDKGWMCRLDLPEKRQCWQTRELLWTEHCFEPFLEWCNETLAQARWLAFYQCREGSTWAKLLRDETDRDMEHRVAVITLPEGTAHESPL